MKHTANARFAIKTWDTEPYSEGLDLPKLTRASVTKTFTGDLEGDGRVEYLMVYRADGSAAFVGLERVVGRSPVKWVRSCSSASAPSRVDRRRKHNQSSRAPQPESFGACAARERRP